jgi:hypothetical protein
MAVTMKVYDCVSILYGEAAIVVAPELLKISTVLGKYIARSWHPAHFNFVFFSLP